MRADKADKGGQLYFCPGGAGGGQNPSPLWGRGGCLSGLPTGHRPPHKVSSATMRWNGVDFTNAVSRLRQFASFLGALWPEPRGWRASAQ